MATKVVAFAAAHRAAVRDLLVEHGWGEPVVDDQIDALDWLAEEPVEGRAFTALVDGEPVGYVAVRFHHGNRLAHVLGLAVRTDRHRRGVATALVAAVEREARSWGARGVYVETPVTNAEARAFYAARGYREGYVMPRFYADGVDGVTYQRFFEARREERRPRPRTPA